MSAAVAVQALVTGLATGAAYGLIALGFTLVHRLTRVLALAHGDIVTGAVFVAILAVVGTMPVAAPLGFGSTVALIVVALLAGAVLSVLVYALALRPFLPRVSDVPGFLIRPAAAMPFHGSTGAASSASELEAFASTGFFPPSIARGGNVITLLSPLRSGAGRAASRA